MIPKITHVKAGTEHKLYINFKGGGTRLFDIKPYLTKGVFKELQDDQYFKKVRLVWGGIEWPHEQDLSAETLYYLGVPIKGSNKSLQRAPRRARR